MNKVGNQERKFFFALKIKTHLIRMISDNQPNTKREVFIVPSTHWDREWYKPFQEFRFKLVGLIDELLEILSKKEYFFTLDGQTIVLEDYLEIKPENKEILLEFIRKGNISVGPWYLLPDEWLISEESFIRNLERSLDLSKQLNIPLMKVGYLPDQFGHSRVIPQILSNLTDIPVAVIWRGVGLDVNTVPFHWKSHENACSGILGNYLPYGYGNAASLSSNLEGLIEDIKSKIESLDQYSPLPVYLLMNGTDHQFPQRFLIDLVPQLQIPNYQIKITVLQNYIASIQDKIKEKDYTPPTYAGEFRSSARAPLLQDTYSARMWIKQWDNKIDDLLVHYVEPMCTILHFNRISEYPSGFIRTAWKWLLRNQPHDSICGCSVDQTHEEMKIRYSWAESICTAIIKDVQSTFDNLIQPETGSFCMIFNPTNNRTIPMLAEFQMSSKIKATFLQAEDGKSYPLQASSTSEDIMFESTFKPFILKNGVKMLHGRKIMDVFINDLEISEDESDPTTLHITLIFGKMEIGEFNVEKLKEDAVKLVDSGKYKKFHVKASMGMKQSYISMLPLNPWIFNKLKIGTGKIEESPSLFKTQPDHIENKFYKLKFNSHGTIDLYDKITNTTYMNLHEFEDWGDRGDEYTFSRVDPQNAKMSRIKRKISNTGSLFSDITQEYTLTLFEQLTKDRKKRVGKTKIPVRTTFRFYRDLPRIDITTILTNTAKDHRLRICFTLPFKSKSTKTSTHFGYIERIGSPSPLKEYTEMPSGIQAQKRFIRVDQEIGPCSMSVFNKGLPEIELVDQSKIALTLVRSIGFLSRQDFPERPYHAGPADATPGAQELNKEYTFQYAFMTHDKILPMNETYNYAESFALQTKSFAFSDSKMDENITKPLLSIPESTIKISSMRIRDGKLTVLMYNLDIQSVRIQVTLNPQFHYCTEILIDGTEKKKSEVLNKKIELDFDPLELKLLNFY